MRARREEAHQQPDEEEMKQPEPARGDEGPGGDGFQTIDLGPDGRGMAEGVVAAPPSLLRKSRSHKAQRLEWNVRDCTVKLRRKRTLTILRDIGEHWMLLGFEPVVDEASKHHSIKTDLHRSIKPET